MCAALAVEGGNPVKRSFSFANLIVACAAGAAIGVLCMIAIYAAQFGGFDSYAAARKFSAVYNAIGKYYIGDADMEDVSDAGYSAMVDATGDQWSAYFNADDYKRLQQYTNNSYNGIGVTIVKDAETELYKVQAVLEDSPASRAGVQIGDTLLSIGDVSLKGKTASQIHTLIEKEKGDFTLVLGAADGSRRTVTVSTAIVYAKPVKYELLNDGIGYVHIKNFETGAGDGIVEAVDSLAAQGAKGIVFDVRGNPGGLLTELLKALDHILPEGDIFVSRDKNGSERVETSDANCVKLPMTVLVNADTYSAAEFFAAALSEYGWAKIVGSHTTGKARSQINIELFDGSAVHLSTRSYLTPKRVDLAETGGLTPDVEVALSEDAENQRLGGTLAQDADDQLQAGISTLKSEIKDADHELS